MGRILGIDFGLKRIGLALSDEGCVIASPYKTINYHGFANFLERLIPLIESFEVSKIVVGYPIGMKGHRTAQTVKVEKFISALKKHTSIPIDFIDERLSSIEATRSLQRQGFKPSREKSLIDETAATIFLQSYLDTHLSS